jgi:hypothetical protein
VTTKNDLLAVVQGVQRDLRDAQAKLGEVARAIAASSLPTVDARPKCPECGVRLRGELSLAEHQHTSHGGPLPAHWARAEALAGLTPDES